MKITVVLHNIRSTYNVGAILRTAEGLGIAKVIYSGYTPRYDDPDLLPHLRDKLNRQIAKSALDAEQLVPQESLGKSETDLTEWLRNAPEDTTIIGLENNLTPEEMPRQMILGRPAPENQRPAQPSRQPSNEQLTQQGRRPAQLGEHVILILGEEVNGIPTAIRDLVDYFLEIPMQGQKESFNVSVATGIALWGLQNCY